MQPVVDVWPLFNGCIVKTVDERLRIERERERGMLMARDGQAGADYGFLRFLTKSASTLSCVFVTASMMAAAACCSLLANVRRLCSTRERQFRERTPNGDGRLGKPWGP